jgi:hypothetical protein
VAKDRFTIQLKCPKCKQEGEAQCEQEDGWAFLKGKTATKVNDVTPGFSRVKKSSFWGEDINFVCDVCGDLSVHDPRK